MGAPLSLELDHGDGRDNGLGGALDRLVSIASRILAAPMAMVTMSGHDRVTNASWARLDPDSASMLHALSATVSSTEALLSIESALATDAVVEVGSGVAVSHGVDDRPALAFLGTPLHHGGRAVGALCVVDETPRTWSVDDVSLLVDLAATADGLLAGQPTSGSPLSPPDTRYRALISSLPGTVTTVFDRSLRVTATTGARNSTRAIPEPGLVGLTPEQVYAPSDAAKLRELVERAFSGATTTVEYHAETTGVDGLLDVVPLPPTGPGGSDEVMVVFRDVGTIKQEARDQVERGHAYFATLLEHGSDVIIVTDRDWRVRYASPAFARVFGDAPPPFESTSLLPTIHVKDRTRVGAVFAALVDEPDAVKRFETRVVRAQDELRTLEVTASNHLADPRIQGIVWNCRDVTDRVEATARLAHQAMHDSLTNLPNRALLLDRLTQALARAERSGLSCALVFIDLDHFKRINDTLGHAAGDQLLIAIGERLRASVRPGDSAARFGGDEFVVLAEDINTVDDALGLAERVRQTLVQPVELAQRKITVDCSIGIAVSQGHRAEALLQEADTALYRAKEDGRGRWELYDHTMRASVQRRLDTEEMIRTAIHDHGLAVAYQPIIDLASGLVSGTEALARIRDSDGSVVLPADFIGVAEDCGLIIPLGAAILDQACGQQASWLARGMGYEQISVNISPRQLASGSLIDEVRHTLELSGLRADQLCLELTESALIDVGTVMRRTIDELKDMGVQLAIDDFGTGWSSLAYLRHFPIDIVKIDRSFIAGLGANEADTEVVRAVIGLGQALHLRTVAEGVETLSQETLLKDLGCDFAQGYRYGRPRFPGTPPAES